MKKIILLLAFCASFMVYGQERDQVNILLFEYAKKMQIGTEDEKKVILNQYDKIIESTNDKILKKEVIEEKERLKNRQFNNSVKAKETSVLTRDDLKGIKISTDKFNNSTGIYHRNNTGTLRFSIFITSEGNMYLRFTSYYKGSSWIFFKYVTILSDGKTYDYIFNDPKRETYSGGVEEWSSTLLEMDQIEDFRKILKSENEISIRFRGDKRYDRTLSKSEKERMKKILDVYDKLKQ